MEVERSAYPDAGFCSGMYTANTMFSAIEAMGISLAYSSTMASQDEQKADSTEKSAFVLVEAIRKQILHLLVLVWVIQWD